MNFIEGEILCIDKPLDWTSFSVVNKLRWKLSKSLNVKKLKVGHAGTLDPKATGVLIVCTGKMTKRIDEFQAKTKEYIATLQLGSTTPSFDSELPIDQTFPTEHIDKQLIDKVIPTFTGEIWQTPPIYSAIKIDGKRAYDYAREGQTVEISKKLLQIDEIEVLAFADNVLKLRVVCSKGTYIRALARDIGTALGSGAYLIGLQRTRIGDVKLENCLSVEQALEMIETACETH
ncbi:MAG: tRNA pseudouridine(55) synthase TruB [Prevotellaceae bacterium]|jgi:tRNA pseudouridine55 synthase|nr:tRNA pseudouridine(55) synthase TruB [Prevotellaceae bacterium]